MHLYLQDVRCFKGFHRIPVRPITFLVGENSTGKTTVLSALNSVLLSGRFPAVPDLSTPPYDLGAFDTIASYHGGRAGRATSFSLGISYDASKSKQERANTVIGTYRENYGQPELCKLKMECDIFDLNIAIDDDRIRGSAEVFASASDDSQTLDIAYKFDHPAGVSSASRMRGMLFDLLSRGIASSDIKPDLADRIESRLFHLLGFGRQQRSPVSVAPIRTKPSRTYDQLTDQYAPEGDHIPLLLARTFDVKTTTPKQREQLTSALARFGEDSGLFRELKVRRLGKSPSDPFQLLIKVGTYSANIADVGYGVSQALPVAVQAISAPSRSILLIQQPEVHLHPRGQAALGSLFCELARSDKKRFVIETHSDFVVDRIRQHVGKGDLNASDVQILYFQRNSRETEVYPITIDETGSLQNAPDGYRDFFIREQFSLFGISE